MSKSPDRDMLCINAIAWAGTLGVVGMVGLDIVGDKLMEINVFSPGGLGSAQKFTSINFSRFVIDALDRKVQYMNYYGRNFDNVDMCTL